MGRMVEFAREGCVGTTAENARGGRAVWEGGPRLPVGKVVWGG